jgi:hypothetical protein
VNLFVAASDARSEGSGRTKTLSLSAEEGERREKERVLRGFSIGHTAFVAGSQDALITERILSPATAEDAEHAQQELESRLVRPQLAVGDALLFDCRILHFGLANEFQKETGPEGAMDALTAGWRLMLYVNYHHSWFHDPKNWNDNEKLFS